MPGIHIFQHSRMEFLASRLAQQLKDPAVRPTDPFERQYVVVGSSGMKDWLRQSLVARTTEGALPIATQLEFAYAPGLGSWLTGETESGQATGDPWAPNALVWHVMASLRTLASDPSMQPLQTYFAGTRERSGDADPAVVGMAEYDVALQVARLFDRYIRNAPAICREFDAGRVPKLLKHDDALWQMKVWQHLRQGALRDYPPQPVRLAQLWTAPAALPANVPRHISIFGLSQLPAVYYEAILKLGDRIRFDWYLLTPTGEYVGDDARNRLSVAWEAQEPLERSPLLLAFGGAIRGAQRMMVDMQNAALDFVDDDECDGPFDPLEGLQPPMQDGVVRLSMLDRVHRGLWRDTYTPLQEPEALGALTDDEADRHRCDAWIPINLQQDLSLRVHACASPVRQVEVLRDTLFALFEADPTLQPRDILVMTPDVARFAPIVQTVFARRGEWVGADGRRLEESERTEASGTRSDAFDGTEERVGRTNALSIDVNGALPDADDGDDERIESVAEPVEGLASSRKTRSAGKDGDYELPFIPYRIVDRSLRTANPMAQVLTSLMALSRSRATRLELIEILALEPVMRRHGLTASQLAQWTEWFEQTHVRYGVDGESRAQFGGPAFTDAFSWSQALDRIALSAALGETDESWSELVPAAGPAAVDPDAAGRCLRAVQSVLAAAARLQQPRTAGDWRALLFGAGDESGTGLLLQVADGAGARAWMWRDIHDALDELAQGQAQNPPLISARVLERYFEQRFDLPVTIPSIGHNSVTFCSLQPSRSVPHKVICLLGLDDGVFPRGQSPSRWDLTAPGTWGGKSSIYYRQPSGPNEHQVLPMTWLDPRDADRTLFLEALLSARQALHVFYTGRDNATGRSVPPASPVSELLRFVSLGATSIDPGHHPLHMSTPLHAFSVGAYDGTGNIRRSYDPDGARQATQLRKNRQSGSALTWSWYQANALDNVNSSELLALLKQPWTVDEWVKWIEKPIESWVKANLRVFPPRFEAADDVAMPVENDGLQTWKVRNEAWQLLVRSLQNAGETAPDADALIRHLMQTEGLALGSEQALQDEVAYVQGVLQAVAGDLLQQRVAAAPVGDTGLRVLLPDSAGRSGQWTWVTSSGLGLSTDRIGADAAKWLTALLCLCSPATSPSLGSVAVRSTKRDKDRSDSLVATIQRTALKGVPSACWLRWYGELAVASLTIPAQRFGAASSRLAWALHQAEPDPTAPSGEVSTSHLMPGCPAHPDPDATTVRGQTLLCMTQGGPTRLRAWLLDGEGRSWLERQCGSSQVKGKLRTAWEGSFNDYKALSNDAFWSWFSADQPWLSDDGAIDPAVVADAVVAWFPLLEAISSLITKSK